jgi:hypothetical protein
MKIDKNDKQSYVTCSVGKGSNTRLAIDVNQAVQTAAPKPRADSPKRAPSKINNMKIIHAPLMHHPEQMKSSVGLLQSFHFNSWHILRPAYLVRQICMNESLYNCADFLHVGK